jgi:DNA-binding transcriptional LysR family regulator
MRLAAQNLHVTSSALNRKINQIERELGVVLFKRTRKGVELAGVGAILLRHAQRTLSDYQDVLAQMKTLAQKSGDIITLAGPESIISWFLPPVLTEFHAQYPQITTAFKAITDTQALIESTRDTSGDFIFGFDLPKTDTFVEIGRCQLPVGAVTDKSHPLSKHKEISLQDCLDYP